MSELPPLIVHIIYRLDVGGLENGLVNLINRMPSEKYRHAIICLTDSTDFSKRIQRPDVAIFEIHKKPGQDGGSFLKVYKLLKQLEPEIVHTRNLAAIEYQLCAFLAGVPFRVQGEHGWDVFDPEGNNVKYRWLRFSLGFLIQRFIPLSRQLEDYLQYKVGISAQKITRICNGVDTERFYPAQGQRQTLVDCPLDLQNKLLIGTVGRMHGVKDQLTLVKAYILACQQSASFAGKACLALIGDGPLRELAVNLLQQHGLDDKAWLPGERQDVAQIMRGFDVFVLPSKAEGISNTILEAMASGLPVIATRVGGNPELVLNETTGLLVEKENVPAMAAALQSLVGDDGKRRQFAEAAWRRAQQEFSMDSMVARYLAVYDRH
ncbi:TIGR03088 family PEP-CTERM/XrtA system glycosyltransferase [Methylomonas sp. SURF-2]|uniref:TIGR03088 family PEP-CTERM/XrtA system glycosyltransferase n=1 Tax=Methylomonas subterranea TaxID=2952225 RepID=A0ABT1TBZ9_9GAMM|nr:TIGR03088 family PEP-CTERM/XrtA system glycosyltransferase [Methylomonas sp. SURF-2]MCQ8102632.1 TIGR03088 family PEP-CTERM/XrtA system glycosyltransferase [Methylomonas sp. SURF-2]